MNLSCSTTVRNPLPHLRGKRRILPPAWSFSSSFSRPGRQSTPWRRLLHLSFRSHTSPHDKKSSQTVERRGSLPQTSGDERVRANNPRVPRAPNPSPPAPDGRHPRPQAPPPPITSGQLVLPLVARSRVAAVHTRLLLKVVSLEWKIRPTGRSAINTMSCMSVCSLSENKVSTRSRRGAPLAAPTSGAAVAEGRHSSHDTCRTSPHPHACALSTSVERTDVQPYVVYTHARRSRCVAHQPGSSAIISFSSALLRRNSSPP